MNKKTYYEAIVGRAEVARILEGHKLKQEKALRDVDSLTVQLARYEDSLVAFDECIKEYETPTVLYMENEG